MCVGVRVSFSSRDDVFPVSRSTLRRRSRFVALDRRDSDNRVWNPQRAGEKECARLSVVDSRVRCVRACAVVVCGKQRTIGTRLTGGWKKKIHRLINSNCLADLFCQNTSSGSVGVTKRACAVRLSADRVRS